MNEIGSSEREHEGGQSKPVAGGSPDTFDPRSRCGGLGSLRHEDEVAQAFVAGRMEQMVGQGASQLQNQMFKPPDIRLLLFFLRRLREGKLPGKRHDLRRAIPRSPSL